jgi:hypothetical protein
MKIDKEVKATMQKALKKALDKPLESILETAKIHVELHKKHGKKYQEIMQENGLRVWTEDQANTLRMIGKSESLFDLSLREFLPSTAYSLKHLAKLPVEFLHKAAEKGQLHSDMTDMDCRRLNHMFRNNWGNFDPAYEMPERVLVNASNESKTWREEMVQFLRDAPDAEYNSEAVYYLERLIGENQDEHRSLEDALALAVSQVKWMEAQVRQRAAITEKVRRVMANATKTKAAKARV